MTEASRDRVQFHDHLVTFLRSQLPEETGHLDDVALRQHIARCEARGAAFGVISELGVSQWVCLTFLGDPEFDANPEVRDFLRAPVPVPDEKMAQLVEGLAMLTTD
jgi:hypothetical protein